MQVDIVIPFYNPKKGWALTLIQQLSELQKLSTQDTYRLILVDDGSKNNEVVIDGFEVLKASHPESELISYKHNRGKGYALREGMRQSRAPLSVFTDVDMPYEAASMRAVVEALANGADVVFGYREEQYYVSVPFFRKWLSRSLRFVLKRVMGFAITDTQCGLKGMNQRGREVFLETTINRFLIDMEFIKMATKRQGIRWKKEVVELRSDIEFSTMGAGILLQELGNFIRLLFR